MTTTTALTLPQRAAVALGAAEHEKQLILLVEESKTITEIKNLDGRTQCHAAYMKLKNARVAIAKTGKAAREDATAFSNAVIAEEKRLITITEVEENRLQQIRDQWDADREAERQAKIAAERERVAEHQSRIESMRELLTIAIDGSSECIQTVINRLEPWVVTAAAYEEFAPQAEIAKTETLAKLREMLAKTVEREGAEAKRIAEQAAEAARLKAEREELARLRAENEARRAAEEEKFEAERQEAFRKAAAEHAAAQAELQAARDKHNAEVAAQRAELERQQQEVARQTAVLEAAQRQREEEAAAAKAAEEAEHRRMVEIEQAEEREKAGAAHAASIAQDVAPRAQEALAEEVAPSNGRLAPHPAWPFPTENAKPKRPTADDIIVVLAAHYGASNAEVIEWLADMPLFEMAN